MRIRIRRWVGICGTVAIVLSLCAPPARAARNVKISAGIEGTEDEANAYMKANLDVVQKTLPEAIRKCAHTVTSADAVVSFRLAVVVDKAGKSIERIPDPSNSFTTCVSHELEPASFTPPPRDPLKVHFQVTLEP